MGMRVVSFKADDELLEALERYARERGVTKGHIIRAALRAYLDHKLEPVKPFVNRRLRIW